MCHPSTPAVMDPHTSVRSLAAAQARAAEERRVQTWAAVARAAVLGLAAAVVLGTSRQAAG